ncbi:MAG: hypothetical protein JRJ69_13515 [Deltaproteobacteria bacterium]|nr:hypothetical protein [Deltaproteobacteria bacterium]
MSWINTPVIIRQKLSAYACGLGGKFKSHIGFFEETGGFFIFVSFFRSPWKDGRFIKSRSDIILGGFSNGQESNI